MISSFETKQSMRLRAISVDECSPDQWLNVEWKWTINRWTWHAHI